MGEILWLGNIVSTGSNTPRYLYNDEGNTIEFRTFKDKCEIAYFDKKTETLYLNDRYKMQFKAIKKQIVHDYAPKNVSEYLNIL